MAERSLIVRLPGGYFDDAGRLHDEVDLAPLVGRDEEALLANRLPAAAMTTVLARTIRRIGAIERIDEALVRELLVADRQVLLLELRQRTFGPRITGSCRCDRPGCAQRISLSYAIDDIPVRALADKRPVYACALPALDGRPRTVMLRLPNGGDQEEICEAVAGGSTGAEALQLLVQRCLVDGELAEPLTPGDLLTAERFLVETAPAVDLAVCARCPACGCEVTVELDVQDFFFGELVSGAQQLYRDVHHLALHYHWSEQDILALTRPKREGYLGLIAETMEAIDAGP
ncbi:MAG TPA: hypothetical protein VLM79_18115 [Kofleriaceae bacterium]|nr:hypothetical protein [Kofleriaceae bacterium]